MKKLDHSHIPRKQILKVFDLLSAAVDLLWFHADSSYMWTNIHIYHPIAGNWRG
ncbi:MAG: hypothetical protein OEV74_07795 [Cyclobacteriaceae bacterium]|nr:hypothetical protein [Cyclobacteriaceae bacterium]MDH4296162.1 hypothetical protein [Cyclobacteriaceae bacterium]MDH5249933.1 hypothetical protein [Cyclobacteriaceae bacterium]